MTSTPVPAVAPAPQVPAAPPVLHVEPALDFAPRLLSVSEASPVDPALVNLVAGYKIQRCIGSGAMGDVYLARQTSLDRPVAIKMLPAELAKNQEFVTRFLSE